MSTLTDQDLDSIEQEASSSRGDYGRSPALLALVAECRQHRARIAAHAAAHPERLSAESLSSLAEADAFGDFGQHSGVTLAVTEIWQRRAAELTPEEVEVVRAWLAVGHCGGSITPGPVGMGVLDKLLRAHGATP